MTIYKDDGSIIRPATQDEIDALNGVRSVNVNVSVTSSHGNNSAFEYFARTSNQARNHHDNTHADNYDSNILNTNPDELVKNGVEKMSAETLNETVNNAEEAFKNGAEDLKDKAENAGEEIKEDLDRSTETKSNKDFYQRVACNALGTALGIIVGCYIASKLS